jgi:pimeloyl-ACP methyl ester carboxylesterase
VATRWPDRETVADGSQGVQLATMQKLASYWATDHEWRKCEAKVNALPQGYSDNRHDFNELIWKIVSPKWTFDDATFDRTAASFDNPDHVVIVIHNYRWRLSLAKGDPKYDDPERKLFAAPVITVPTITISSDFDGPAADGKAYASKFTGKYSHQILSGIGHNVPQEAPEAFAKAVVEVDAC